MTRSLPFTSPRPGTTLLSAAALCLIVPGAAAAEVPTDLDFDPVAVITGMADARDGDDVVFGQVAVRLRGIAAPEDGGHAVEPGGPESTRHLRALVAGREVVCWLDGTHARNRPVGVCYVDGLNLNRAQVEAGHARDCPRFSSGGYAEAEARARAAGRDLAAIYDLPGYC